MSNGDVIGVSVVAIGRKGYDHLRFDPANMCDDLANGFLMICLIDIPIDVIQKRKTRHAEFLHAGFQLFGAQLAESFEAGILLFGAEPTPLPA